MKSFLRVLCTLILLLPLSAYASDAGKTDSAERAIVSCYATNLRGKICLPQALQKHGNVLLSAYGAGDKSVLPTLMRLNALSIGLRSLDTKFFSHAMLDDLDGFLLALSSTQKSNDVLRSSQLVGSVCSCPEIPRRQFDEIRGKLEKITQDSPVFDLAQQCRRDLEDTNATLIVTYFPSNTFQSPGGNFLVEWYSSVLYALEEHPLWPADPSHPAYRFTWIRSFHDPVSITLSIEPEGSQLKVQKYSPSKRQLESSRIALNGEEVRKVQELIQEANFWSMVAEETRGGGTDGAEWILEGARGNQYHIVSRWNASGTPFGKALLELIRLSGYNPPKNEVY